MELQPKKLPNFEQDEDILYLDGYFFVKKDVIKKNDELVQKTFKNFYKYVTYN